MKSSIVDMENLHSDDDSDYAADFSNLPSHVNSSHDQKNDANNEENSKLTGDITKGVANMIWQESSQRAQKAFKIYTNIDILRPYFDVEPNTVKQRLISSLIPNQLYGIEVKKIPRELYGPNMIVLSLVAMLLMQMKTASVFLKEGTLMGSALGICFGYWVMASCLLWLLSYIFNIRMALLQALHLMGYGLFGPCLVVFVTTVIHPHGSHSFFYATTLLFCSLSVFQMVSVIKERTRDKRSLSIVAAVMFCLQFLFLFYLHFSYHHESEETTDSIQSISLYDLPINAQDSFTSSTVKMIEEKIISPVVKLQHKFRRHTIRQNATMSQ